MQKAFRPHPPNQRDNDERNKADHREMLAGKRHAVRQSGAGHALDIGRAQMEAIPEKKRGQKRPPPIRRGVRGGIRATDFTAGRERRLRKTAGQRRSEYGDNGRAQTLPERFPRLCPALADAEIAVVSPAPCLKKHAAPSPVAFAVPAAVIAEAARRPDAERHLKRLPGKRPPALGPLPCPGKATGKRWQKIRSGVDWIGAGRAHVRKHNAQALIRKTADGNDVPAHPHHRAALHDLVQPRGRFRRGRRFRQFAGDPACQRARQGRAKAGGTPGAPVRPCQQSEGGTRRHGSGGRRDPRQKKQNEYLTKKHVMLRDMPPGDRKGRPRISPDPTDPPASRRPRRAACRERACPCAQSAPDRPW